MLSTVLTLVRLLKAILRSWNRPHFRSGFLLAGLILFSGTVFYKTVEGWSWVDALYFSAMTLATVGVSDLAPQSVVGRLFTVLYPVCRRRGVCGVVCPIRPRAFADRTGSRFG